MRMSDETKAVDFIRSGKETEHQSEIRTAHEDSAMAKAFVKAGFVDLQSLVLSSVDDYSPHRVIVILEEVERFKNAIEAYRTAENRTLILLSKINPTVGVLGGFPPSPAELSAINLKEDLNDDARELVLNRFSSSEGTTEEDASS